MRKKAQSSIITGVKGGYNNVISEL